MDGAGLNGACNEVTAMRSHVRGNISVFMFIRLKKVMLLFLLLCITVNVYVVVSLYVRPRYSIFILILR